MTHNSTESEIEVNYGDQYREIICLKDLVKRQHHIIDYLENRLYCALIDGDHAD